jgi:GABA(A) receptor-associated protein
MPWYEVECKCLARVPPVYINLAANDQVGQLKRGRRYLFPPDQTASRLQLIVRQNIPELRAEEGIWCFLITPDNKDVLLNQSDTMATIQQDYKHEDGFVYVKYSKENSFGGF